MLGRGHEMPTLHVDQHAGLTPNLAFRLHPGQQDTVANQVVQIEVTELLMNLSGSVSLSYEFMLTSAKD
jgi:hypothetical protein